MFRAKDHKINNKKVDGGNVKVLYHVVEWYSTLISTLINKGCINRNRNNEKYQYYVKYFNFRENIK
jgi:hypothetical protein